MPRVAPLCLSCTLYVVRMFLPQYFAKAKNPLAISLAGWLFGGAVVTHK